MDTQTSGKIPAGSSNKLAWIVIAVVFGAACFYGGVLFEKSHNKTAVASTTSSRFGGRGGFGGGFGGGDRVFGQVTAVSATSITVQDTRSGTSTTLAITSSTEITDNGQTASASSIQTGQEVFITEDSSNTKQAARIMVNPSFGGGPEQQSQSSTSSSATTD